MWRITKKDLKIFLTDKRGLFLSLLLPVGLITLFAFAFGGVIGEEEESVPLRILYTDADHSEYAVSLIAMLDSIPGLECAETDSASARASIRSGKDFAAIIIHKGFGDALEQGKDLPVLLQYDAGREMEVSILQNLLISRLAEMKGALDAEHGIDRIMRSTFATLPEEMKDSLQQELLQGFQNEVQPEQLVRREGVVGDAETGWGLIQAVAGTAIMMLLFSVSAIGKSMLEEKESGVLRKLLQSPVAPVSILFGKLMTAVIISIFQLIVMFTFAWLAFGLPIFLQPGALILMIIATAIACASFGVLLASVVTSRQQADSLGTIIILFMSAIGGSMIPLYIMPVFMQKAAVISVNYWSIQGFYDIFWRQGGIEAVLNNVCILSAITLVIGLLSVYFFQKNILRLV